MHGGAVTELRLYSFEDRVDSPLSPGEFLKQVAASTGEGHPPSGLPNLRALSVDSIWGENRETVQKIDSELQSFFTQRAHWEGARIHTLRILGPRILWEDDLEKLHQIVPCVESDGVPGNVQIGTCDG